MRDYMDRLLGKYKQNAESSTLINCEQASKAQCRILAVKTLWSAGGPPQDGFAVANLTPL